MAFKLDKNNTGFQILPEGEYEVFPHVFAKETAQTSGNKMAQFNYIVRDDVDQPGQGQEIRFDNFVDTPAALWRVNQASEAAGLDMEKEYDDVWDWAEDFVNKAVRVKVGHRTYNDKTYPEIKEFMPSRYGGEFEGKKDDAPANANTFNEPGHVKDGASLDISDDDLPF